MKDPKWILREVKTHLALVKYERERIEERGLSPDLLEDRDFLIFLPTLEKYGVIPSAEYWKKLRRLRNDFVHLYPWETELKLEAVKRALEEVDTLEGIVKKIEEILK